MTSSPSPIRRGFKVSEGSLVLQHAEVRADQVIGPMFHPRNSGCRSIPLGITLQHTTTPAPELLAVCRLQRPADDGPTGAGHPDPFLACAAVQLSAPLVLQVEGVQSLRVASRRQRTDPWADRITSRFLVGNATKWIQLLASHMPSRITRPLRAVS